MDALDLAVLQRARCWHEDGHALWLVSVVETWGSAPRPVGSLLAVRDDGAVAGSVSGGCVEDDLVRRVSQGERPSAAGLVCYGVSKEEASRFGLPCGGTLRLLVEPLLASTWLEDLLQRASRHELVARTVELGTGTVTLAATQRGARPTFDGERFTSIFGPQWRLLLIGAGQLSRIVAQMAQPLGFSVHVCDPRSEYHVDWDVAHVHFEVGMPDDVVLAMEPDAHTAIVALTHDPKLDDMALLEALKSPAFYVGALGSRRNTHKRRERLALFDLADEEIQRLHGPVGLYLGSRTPAEIAISILAEIVAVKNGIPVVQVPPAWSEETPEAARHAP
ncbi:XdhC family protein [Chitinimonas viridis]|uniref:XdhC family protein n=1 Tax=Chitinimonas viridis TaxID=664880 RepID=A0ABT8B516_9NEIS|nr:XdhC family protein [Chitinimonas viridis]MDN3577358.1 XdhC family protein [Chitinimonas viridis]